MSSSNSSTPSLAALLGLVAVAGYQNRDKLGSLLGMITGGGSAEKVGVEKTSGGGLMGSLTGALGSLMGGAGGAGSAAGMAGALGGLLGAGNASGGIGELVTKMTGNGMGEVVKSWVSTGPNTPVSSSQLESVLGSDVLSNVIAQTGLSREELLSRLSTILPEAIDKMTPNGRLPS